METIKSIHDKAIKKLTLLFIKIAVLILLTGVLLYALEFFCKKEKHIQKVKNELIIKVY